MKKKKLMCFLMAGTMTMALLTGCGNSTQANAAASRSETAEATEAAQTTESETESEPTGDTGVLVIAEQGLFSAGGITVTSDGTFDPGNQWEETGAGQTAHVDHANVFYQIPAEETGLPMVFLHGYGQSRMGWMTTPDGREG